MRSRLRIQAVVRTAAAAIVLLVLGVACATSEEPDPQATATRTTAPAGPMLSHADCVTYDPAALQVEGADDVWRLNHGEDILTAHRTEADAEAMLSVAERYTQQCFIGRGNDREHRRDYVLEYWRNTDDVVPDGLPEIGCIDYDEEAVDIEDQEELGYILTDGETNMHLLDNILDAQQALTLARQHSRMCLIGADTDLIHEYWL